MEKKLIWIFFLFYSRIKTLLKIKQKPLKSVRMTTNDFKKYFKKNFWKTSSFFSGMSLLVVDCITVMF